MREYKKKVEANGKDFSKLNEIARMDDKLIIYGCGVNGEIICSYLRSQGKEIAFFCDKQAERRSFRVLGVEVIPPEDLFNNHSTEKVIVSPDNSSAIVRYLIQAGIPEENILLPFKQVEYDIRKSFRIDEYVSDMVFEPEVTVFTILYNTPKELFERTIESVLAQTYKELTYLVIDNGSTDGSRELIASYAEKDARIKPVFLDENVPWTSKELLSVLSKNVKTEYVCMVDSDDYYEPTFIERTVALAKKTASDIVQVNTLTYSDDQQRYSYFNQILGYNIILEGDDIYKYLLCRILMVTFWGKLYASKILKDLIDHMMSYSDKERDDIFRLDISWVTFVALRAKRVYLCDELLHVRTWRSGSSETSTGSMIHWLNSMTWSIDSLIEKGINPDKIYCFADGALMWLFGLERKGIKIYDFRPELINNHFVKEFLERPVCDYLKD